MDFHVKEYYKQYSDESPRGNFHKVIALHEAPDISWKELARTVPALPKGWLELSHLSVADRIEFIMDFWLSKVPFRPGWDSALQTFFSALDDIGIYITQKHFDDPYEVHLVYSVKENGGFFRGNIPASEKEINDLCQSFSGFILPADYLAFLQVHDGFCKTTDCTGLIHSKDMHPTYLEFQNRIQALDPISSPKGIVDPNSLIPFYESFGMPFFQCFWADWYPEDEMGNVYYSGTQGTISEVTGSDSNPDAMAFPTFTDWLIFYLERLI